MSPSDGPASRLAGLERAWRETRNPVWAWIAIDRCLNGRPPAPIPDWAMIYLADAAGKLGRTGWGLDFRPGREQEPLAPDLALAAVPEALGLVKQGQKNAFARAADEAAKMRAALVDSVSRTDVTGTIAGSRNVTRDRARRIIARGRTILGLRR